LMLCDCFTDSTMFFCVSCCFLLLDCFMDVSLTGMVLGLQEIVGFFFYQDL
jgi:hypothetical protein